MAATPSPLARKLVIRENNRVLVLEPPEGYLGELHPLPEGATMDDAGVSGFDVVQIFVRSSGELDGRLPAVIDARRPGGVLWVTYPKLSAKQSSDLSRDSIREMVETRGWTAVTQVAVDGTWSALRLRPIQDVGKARS